MEEDADLFIKLTLVSISFIFAFWGYIHWCYANLLADMREEKDPALKQKWTKEPFLKQVWINNHRIGLREIGLTFAIFGLVLGLVSEYYPNIAPGAGVASLSFLVAGLSILAGLLKASMETEPEQKNPPQNNNSKGGDK
ncbi:MAG: hypothetical protein WC471_03635 [Candidatus Woesearchaeota archaeon]